MTARLLDWPDGLGISSFEIVEGPQSSNSGNSAATLTGETQMVSAVKSPWVFRVGLSLRSGQRARRGVGMLIASGRGANAVRFPLSLIGEAPDPTDLGLSAGQQLTWTNGSPWNNGLGWQGDYPTESVTANAAKDAGTITLGSDAWGDKLGYGDWFGIEGHFAAYMVTGTFVGQPGKVRCWPPLRKAVLTTDVATLLPTMAVVTVGSPQVGKTTDGWETAQLTLVEVPDVRLRDHYVLD